MNKRFFLFLFLSIFLGACTTTIRGYPDVAIDVDDIVKRADPYLYELLNSKEFSKEERDRYIQVKLIAIDAQYLDFVNQLKSQNNSSSIVVSLAKLGINAIASTSAIPSATGKANAHALSALITGGKESFDKVSLFNEVMPGLILKMDANRKKVLNKILSRTKNGIDQYPYALAASDLNDYYQAGTLYGAINGVSEDAGLDVEDLERKKDDIISFNAALGSVHDVPPTSRQECIKEELKRKPGSLREWYVNNKDFIFEQVGEGVFFDESVDVDMAAFMNIVFFNGSGRYTAILDKIEKDNNITC
ncbi:MAG: hypothetical protein JG718_09960 [Candidatus Thiothrix moscowensis]|nr:hypothetical protein [Candidatus Thiothrix moscowensis]